MPVTKRIIPCLDIKDGQVVKGTQFEELRNMGDPIELAAYYTKQSADELVLLDITATHEKRRTFLPMVTGVANAINIPFTVGGGIGSIDDAYQLLAAGADKTSINSAAVHNPNLITELAKQFGSQCVVVAIDAKQAGEDWEVYINGGRKPTGIRVLDWVKRVIALGAGELLVTSIDQDGARTGFNLPLMAAISEISSIPVIASGGAGIPQHFADVLAEGMSDAALAAGIFHENILTIPALKSFLRNQNIFVR